jgi:hypothetical protein
LLVIIRKPYDENGKPAAVDTASTDRAAAQIPPRPESPKSTLAHINSSVRPDSNFASSDMNSPPSTPQPTDAGSAQKTTASTRNTTAGSRGGRFFGAAGKSGRRHSPTRRHSVRFLPSRRRGHRRRTAADRYGEFRRPRAHRVHCYAQFG